MPQMTMAEYIATLLVDCKYDTAAQRKGWLQLRFSKNYADELSPSQQYHAISLLKLEKEQGVPGRTRYANDEDDE